MPRDRKAKPVVASVGLMLAWLLLGNALRGQQPACDAPLENDPVLVLNTGDRLTYVCPAATRLQVIQAVGRQTRLPIGLVLGQDTRSMLRQRRAYSIRNRDGRGVLAAIIQGTGYTLREEDGVTVLIAGDLSGRQRRLLHHRHMRFETNPGETVPGMGQYLTMWMRVAAGARGYFGLGGPGSTNDERFTLPPIAQASTEELANRIVKLGPHGIWIFRASAQPPRGEPTDTVEIESYQHFSNRPQIGGERQNP